MVSMSYRTHLRSSRTLCEQTTQDSQHVLSHPFKLFTYSLRADQGREKVSISCHTHSRSSRTNWGTKAARRSACAIVLIWGVDVQTESGPRPRDSQHVLSHPLEVFTYKLRADQGREAVSMSYRTHLRYSLTSWSDQGRKIVSMSYRTYLRCSRTAWERTKTTRQSVCPIPPIWGIHVTAWSDPGRKIVSISYRTHLRSLHTSWERAKAARSSACLNAPFWSLHVQTECRTMQYDRQHALSHHMKSSRTSWSDQAQRWSACPIVRILVVHIRPVRRPGGWSHYGVSVN
jgi:hypothetical protein